MGIQGLLGALRPITTQAHVNDLQGLRVGVDAYVWLHRGAYACAQDLCLGRETKKYLHICFQRLSLLLDAGVGHVTIVFDGGPLPAKKATEEDRLARRQENKQKAMQLLGERGRAEEAFAYFTKAVDVTPSMANEWIKSLQRAGLPNVSFVVAPYEADAQLAFLCKTGQLDAVITEDSDILAYGCPRVLFKLDADGRGQQILHADCFRAPIAGLGDLRNWDEERFLSMCILSGCDYLPSLPGMGLRTAFRYLNRQRTAEKAVRTMIYEQKVPPDTIQKGYLDKFKRALWTFRHQRVFDPVARVLTHVHPVLAPELAQLPRNETDYLGPWMEDSLAAAIADAEIDPISLAPFPTTVTVSTNNNDGGGKSGGAGEEWTLQQQQQRRMAAFFAPAANENVNGNENEEEQEGSSGAAAAANTGGAAAAAVTSGAEAPSSASFPSFIYRPGLRKSAPPLQQNNRITGYLKKTATSALHHFLHHKRKAPSSPPPPPPPQPTEEFPVLDEREGKGEVGASGNAQADNELGAAATAAAVASSNTSTAPSISASSCLPRMSTWFGSAGGGGQKENDAARANADDEGRPSVAGAGFSGLLSRAAGGGGGGGGGKRQRTLGGKPSSFALKRFALRGTMMSTTASAQEEAEGEGEGEGLEAEDTKEPAAAAAAAMDEATTPYGDSLQPPTPDTPFGGGGGGGLGRGGGGYGGDDSGGGGKTTKVVGFQESFACFSYHAGEGEGEGEGGTTLTSTGAMTLMATNTTTTTATAAATPTTATKGQLGPKSNGATPPVPSLDAFCFQGCGDDFLSSEIG